MLRAARTFAEGVGVTLMLVVQLASFGAFAGTSMGIVREHCLDFAASSPSAGVDIDDKWTYIIWPPFTLANLDPSGGCVRNSPLREALSGVGVWDLPSSEEQVREHIGQQVESP